MLTSDAPQIHSFPLERPRLRGRRRDSLRGAATLPYFISGDENRLVRFLAESPEPLFDFGNPLLLTGPTGCGKTVIALHVAAKQACAAPDDDQPSLVVYYTAVDFAREYAEAVASDDLPPLRTALDQAAVLVIDDLHLIADKSAAQEELAGRIERRTFDGLATIVTCNRLPSEVRGMRSLLASRVLPGLTVPVRLPATASRRALLGEIAVFRDLDISAELLDILKEGLEPNLSVRHLDSALKQISLWCQMNASAATIAAVQVAIDSVGPAREISLSMIANAVAKRLRMRTSDLRSNSRKQHLVRARGLAMLLSRRLTDQSMHHIGDYYGGRDHTTVLHAVRKTESLLDHNAELRQAADELTEKLTQV